jgi:predicted nucleic acid-binding Zn finger protein
LLIAAISTCIVLGSGEVAHTRPVRTADFVLVENRAFCSCWRFWSSLDSDVWSDACALRRRANTISSSSSK